MFSVGYNHVDFRANGDKSLILRGKAVVSGDPECCGLYLCGD
jgi:hypothetical protein